MSTRVCPETGLPLGEPAAALDLPHFPARFQAVIWRNWGVVTPTRLAKVLKTTAANVATAARDLGLGEPTSPEQEHVWLQRGYITLIRQNWHLLPYPQLLELIGKSPKEMAYALKEDDFLWNKLGRAKPDAAPVAWTPLTPEQERLTAELRRLIEATCGNAQPAAEPPFGFLRNYGKRVSAKAPGNSHANFDLKLLYSYSAVYGDPLLDPELDPYPDGLLSDLAANGVNAVWLQGVLYTLVPWFGDTPYSEGHETRIRNLNALVAKAARYGIGVYLYINEPRGMQPAFYERFPDWKGGYYPATDTYSMCTSNPEVLNRLRAGLTDLFTKAPGLAGVFTITLSENLTHCRSKSAHELNCPRCIGRSTGDLVAEVNNAIEEGVHAAKPDAKVLVWNWAWLEDWWRKAIDQFRPGITLMCTSESYMPTEAMGIHGKVSDYAMSRVGPSAFSRKLWRYAAGRGLVTAAKVQVNNTWECSAVPYLPVPFLVKQHLRNLQAEKISGLMLSWTLGGYPGGNLRLTESDPEELALEWFGERAVPGVIEAWRMFGDAFAEFPFHGAACLYSGPQNYGPMNLLFAAPSGRHATMVGFPYDDLTHWRGNHFPVPVFEEQFRKLSEGWGSGLARLKEAARLVPGEKRAEIEDLLNVAEAAYCHFRTTYLQIHFIRLRDEERTPDSLKAIQAVLNEEIELVKTLLAIVRRDSRIGFEASNHYYYNENTLKEKILNCENVRRAFPLNQTA